MTGRNIVLIYAQAIALFSLYVFCQQWPCSAASLSPDNSVAKHMPDFTAVYNLHIDFPLANTPMSAIRQELTNYFDDLNKKIARNPSAYIINGKPAPRGFQFPPNAPFGPLDAIMSGLTGEGLPRNIVVTISQRSDRICVKFQLPDVAGEHVWLYDGTKTSFGSAGHNGQVYRGYNFNIVDYFMFPGRAVGDLPLARKLSPTADGTGHWKADVAMTNTSAAPDGSPFYLQGWVSITQNDKGGALVVRSFGGDGTQSQACTYADYRTVAPGLMLPSSVVMKLARKPGGILSSRVYSVYTYTLVNATADPLPELTDETGTTLDKPATVTDYIHNPHRYVQWSYLRRFQAVRIGEMGREAAERSLSCDGDR